MSGRKGSARSGPSGLSSVFSNIPDVSNGSGSIKKDSSALSTANTSPATVKGQATSIVNSRHRTANSTSKPSRHRYRGATEAPQSFKDQTQILLEEGIYHLAIQSLQTNLFSRSYYKAEAPWWVAPPAHIALLGTLVIHPKYTTWATADNERIVAVRAHQYLLDVLRSVGPVNGHFRKAFTFHDDRTSRAGRRRRHSPDGSDMSDEDSLKTPLANEDSIWNRVPDFWTMLGWAFSCTASHPERWVHWKLWLELFLEVMERDVEERTKLDEEGGGGKHHQLKESIILSYVLDKTQLRKIVRVLFAFTDDDAHSYQEIWPKETRAPTSTNKRKRDTKVDLEKGEYGDWFDDSDEFPSGDDLDAQGLSPAKTRPKRRGGRPKKQQTSKVAPSPSLEETIPIRRRIFALISRLCYVLGDDAAPFSIDELYDEAAGRIRDLPLNVFPRFVWSDMPVANGIFVTLARDLLADLLPPGVVQPIDVDPDADAKGSVSAIIMERCFLPYASKSVAEDNAKLAVVLWELFSFLWSHEDDNGPSDASVVQSGIASTPSAVSNCGIGPSLSDGMKEAIERGMEEREKKSKMKNEAPPRSVLEPKWLEEKMKSIEMNPHAPQSVIRMAHMKFRLIIEKSEEAEERSGQSDKGLGADFLGWK